MANSIDDHGVFWIESDPTNRIPGHLTFNPKTGGRVALHGAFLGHGHRRTYDRVLGDIKGRSCVLEQCFEVAASSFQVDEGRVDKFVTLRVNSAITAPRGRAPAADTRFQAVDARITGLSEFDDRQPFTFDSSSSDGDDGWDMRVAVKQLDARSVEADRLTLTILHSAGMKSGTGFDHHSVTSRHTARIKLHETGSLPDVLAAYSWVHSLIVIALHGDCRLDGPLVLHRATGDGHAGTDDRHDRIEFHAVWPRGRKLRRPEFIDRTMTFDQLTGDGVRRLLDLNEEFGHVLRRLTSVHFQRVSFFEDTLVRVVSAADSLHRAITGLKKAPTRKVLTDLATMTGPTFSRCVPDLASWADDVVQLRDDAAHNKGQPIREPALAQPMAMSVYWLTLLGVLVHAGVPAAAVASVASSQPFIHAMNPLHEAYGG